MTTVIDERVVEMRFNNEDFEKNVAQSMNTLDKLKEALKFQGGAKSLEEIGRASNSFKLSGISEAVSEATTKFSALDVAGVTAIANITNRAVDFGINFVKSMSIDQVEAGFKKYADKTTAVQTIIASTGKSIDDVEKSMERLNWFTDETSYNFVDMVSNIGKFTSAGVDLDKAQSAMQGIANWAARSGQNAAVASRAMYNFAQAMGTGAMQTKDWMSIENANMATKEFKQTALETAAELGKLKKVSDTTFTTLDGKTTITAETLRDSLKKKWFDSDVMIATLNKYNSYADELYALSEKTGRTATQLMMDADDYAKGTLDIKQISESTGVSVEELAKAYESLNSETNKLSREAFKNAQEAKTFQEVLDATADAVSTGWMNTFQTIFGNYEEAKALWTGLANTMVDVFTRTGTIRNEILGFWKDLGGRESLIRGLVQMLNLVVKPLQAIGAAFKAVMPGTKEAGTFLADLTKRFENLMRKLQPSQEVLSGIYLIFKGIFTIIKVLVNALGSLLGVVSPISGGFASFVNIIGTFITYVAAFISAIAEYAEELGIFSTISETISSIFSKVAGFVSKYGGVIIQGIGGIIGIIIQAVSTLVSKSGEIFSALSPIFSNIFGSISGYVEKFLSLFNGDIFQSIGGFVTFIISAISSAGSYIANFLKTTNVLEFAINKISSAFEFLKSIITGLFAPTEKATTVVKKMEENYSQAAVVTAEFGTLTADAGEEVESAVTPVSLLMSVLQKLAGVAKLVGLVLGGIALGIYKAFEFIFSLFNKDLSGSTKQVQAFAGNTEKTLGGTQNVVSSLKDKIKGFYDELAGGKFDISGKFQAAGKAIYDFIANLDEGKVAAIALSIGLLAIVFASVKLAKQVGAAADSVTSVATTVVSTIKGLGDSIKGTFNSISNAINTFAKRSKILETVKTFAIAFTMVAASLTVLSMVPTDKLLIVSAIMAGFIAVFSILTGVVIHLAKKLNDAKFQLSFRSLSKTLILLAASMGILAASVSLLAATKIEGSIPEFFSKIGGVVILLAAVVGAAIALSKFTKTLPKGAILLLAIAVAMRQLALAVKDFASLSVDNINDHWGTYIAIFGGLSLVMAAAGHVKVSSAFALLALAKAMKIILPAVNEIVAIAQNLPYDAILKAASDNLEGLLPFILMVIAALAFILAIIDSKNDKLKKMKKLTGKGSGGNLFGGIGGAFVGIGIGLALVVAAIKSVHKIYDELKPDELWDIAGLFGVLIAVMGVITAGLLLVNKYFSNGFEDKGKIFSRMATLFIAMGLAMRIMAGAIKVMAGIEDMGKAWQAVVMISILMGVMTAVVGVAGTVPKAIPAVAAIMAAVIAVGFLLGELAILSIMANNPDIWKGIAILAGIFVALNVTMRSLEKIQNVKPGPIFGVLGIIVAMTASLILLSKLNFIKVLSSAFSMTMVFLALGHLFKIINSMDTPSLKKIGAILALVIEMCLLAVPLYFLSKQDWKGILASGGALALAILAIAGVLKIIQNIKPPKVTTILALYGVLVAMGLMAVPLYFLAQQDWKSVLAGAGALSVALLAMTAALAILSAIGNPAAQIVAAASLAIVAVSLVAVAQALTMLKDFDLGDIASKMGVILGIMSGIILVFGLIASIPVIGEGFMLGLLAFSVAIISLAAAFGIFALSLTPLAEGLTLLNPALKEFATVDFVSIGTGLINLSDGLKAIGFAGIIVGVGAIGLGLLAGALYLLGLAAGASYESLNNLAAVPLTDLAWGLAALGVAGAVIGLLSPALIAASVGIALFSGALLLLNVALQGVGELAETFGLKLNIASLYVQIAATNIKKAISDLFADLKKAFTGSPAESVIKAANMLGANIGGGKHPDTGFIGGIANVLGWHSIPDEILNLLSDVGLGFSSDTEASSAAAGAGEKVGNEFGSNLWDKVSSWLSGTWGAVITFFDGLDGGSEVVSTLNSDLGSAGAQAEKFGKSVNQTSQKVGFLGTIQNKANEYINKGKEELGDIVGLVEDEFLPDTDEMTEAMEEAMGAADGLAEGLDGAGGSAGKAGKSIQDLADSLRSGLDLFSKFEAKSDMTSQQLLENMKSNIDGYASWSHRMTVLAKRFADNDIPVSLLEKLRDDGPKQQEVMNAIYNMTDDELAQLRELYATGMALPESQAAIVGDAFTYMGEMATKGFSNALDDHDAAHAAAHGLGGAALDGLAEALEVNSPSKATERIGYYLIDGLCNGLDSTYGQGKLYFAVKHVSDEIQRLFDENLSPDKVEKIGSGLLSNNFTSLLAGSEEDNPIMSAFETSLTNFELLDEALILFQEHIIELINELFEMEDSESRSELFFRYTLSWIQSIVDCLIENEVLVLTQFVLFITHILDTITEADLPSSFYDLGASICEGLAQGIIDHMDTAVDAARELANAVREAADGALEVNSPSKVFIRLGHSIDEGLVIGIEDGAQPVYNAAASLAENGISGMEDNMGRLQQVLSEEMDFNPIITPMLDLSLIRQQMDELNGIMTDPYYGIGQNGGGLYGNQPTQQFNFTQNNYSPKALSRIDIYRQTKNQISMVKGVAAHA